MSTFVKRMLDLILGIVGIIFVLPLFPVIALLIKLDSKGPIFYLCDRIGKNGRLFKMFKFRTMMEVPAGVGTSLSPEGDVRVTDFGRILRRTKLNELPQLINILKGEMSFVGPRPEARDLAELYPEEAKILFSVKPGLVGPSQISNRNEEELYPEGVNPKDYYIKHILPDKLQTDLKYVSKPTLLKDLKYIFLAIKETLFGVIGQRHFFENRSQIYLFLFDIAFVIVCYFFAILLRFESQIPGEGLEMFVVVLPVFLIFRVLCFIGFGLYGVLIRYLNLQSYVTVVKAVTVSSLLSAATIYALGYYSFPRSIYIIDWFCLNFFMILIRYPGKIIRDKIYGKVDDTRKRVLIYGAGDKGNLAALELQDKVMITGFLDDDRSKRNKKVQEFKVIGNRFDIEPLSKIYQIDEIVLAVPNMDEGNLNHVISLCNRAKVNCSMFSTMVDSQLDRLRKELLHNKKVYNLVGNQEIDIKIDYEKLRRTFGGKKILIVGGTNPLGTELLKSLSDSNPQKVILFDKYESYLIEILGSLSNRYAQGKIESFLYGLDLKHTAGPILLRERPQIVIYMGTRKYSSPLEINPVTLVKENILQVWDLMEMAEQSDCELFMMLSSIGVEKPKTIIESSLKLSEGYFQNYFHDSKTKGVTLRLCHLVENRGGLIQNIQNQIRNGEKVIHLNHPSEKDYFITASLAAKMLLATSITAMNSKVNGSICVPSLNGPVKILDLTKLIIQDFGLDPERDIQFEFDRRGFAEEWEEKIHFDGQIAGETEYENLKMIWPAPFFSKGEVKKEIEEFRCLAMNDDRPQIEKKIREAVDKRRSS
jgi:FlaA1/EpsC-like NDP-sugar epimerase/lipopolysaccharide/colanic/teichoic acid biosynthesis glycosyltransferase